MYEWLPNTSKQRFRFPIATATLSLQVRNAVCEQLSFSWYRANVRHPDGPDGVEDTFDSEADASEHDFKKLGRCRNCLHFASILLAVSDKQYNGFAIWPLAQFSPNPLLIITIDFESYWFFGQKMTL